MTNYTFLSANVFAAITEESVRHFVDAVAGGFHVLVEYHNGFTASIVKNTIVSGNLDLWEIVQYCIMAKFAIIHQLWMMLSPI